MSAQFHPAEDVLVSYAAGSLDEGVAILIASHLSLCPACRQAVSCAEAVGGELVEDIAPVALLNSAASVMNRLDDASFEHRPVDAAADPMLPRPLRDYLPGGIGGVKWRWAGPGVRYAQVMSRGDTKVGLMRIAAGTKMPHHGHSDEEFTMVLSGGYSDAGGSFRRGDVEFADGAVAHQPVADADGDCLCLVVTRGKLKFNGTLARVLGPFLAP